MVVNVLKCRYYVNRIKLLKMKNTDPPELFGQVLAGMIYTHVIQKGGMGVQSPLDTLNSLNVIYNHK